ncbi:AAA family ATPase [Mycobacteroides abscessus]|uniref:AAA family ATPase n=1 Tax=Mycobacteroides abscessus TaxID=36809 RepID=UPI0009A63D04|nr:AAA family ATPase [Mycobacteroides abscessus]SKU62064.1 ZTL protein [Mycobacteroides abscessus subsp. massiliense]
MKRLDLIVGPNGSGKTTFVAKFLAPLLHESVFVNADEIAKRLWPDEDPAPRAYEAARIAEQTRQALISQGRPFIAETVFSHPSKLDLIRSAQAADYTVRLLVLLVPEELTVQRVAARVEAGGHTVPIEKIRARYQRLWPLIADAITLADSTVVFDNSSEPGPRVVARMTRGQVVGTLIWPQWTPAPLRQRWADTAY